MVSEVRGRLLKQLSSLQFHFYSIVFFFIPNMLLKILNNLQFDLHSQQPRAVNQPVKTLICICA